MKGLLEKNMLIIAMMVLLLVLGCNDGSSSDSAKATEVGECPETNLDIAVCDPGAGPFSLTIDNEFFPLVVGTRLVLEGEEDGEPIRLEISVTDETEVVAGVTTRVVLEVEFEDDELVEVSRNFFAQAPDGTVCYFGEDVDDYEDGEIVSHEGEWRAGEDGNLPGIFMPADPEVGMAFSQEFAPGIAEDLAEIVMLGEPIDVPAGAFEDTLTAEDCNPNEGGAKDTKVYVRGIGLAVDAEAMLISF